MLAQHRITHRHIQCDNARHHHEVDHGGIVHKQDEVLVVGATNAHLDDAAVMVVIFAASCALSAMVYVPSLDDVARAAVGHCLSTLVSYWLVRKIIACDVGAD